MSISDSSGLNERGFELLFQENFKKLCFLGMKYVKDMDTAREIVQESFMALWEKREQIDTTQSVGSYLATAVHRKCLNYLRDNKKFNHNLLVGEHLHPESKKDHAIEMILGAELSEKIETLLAELPDRSRQVFLMSRMEDLKYQEIADKLDISVKTVEAHMSKALAFLRKGLGDYLPLFLYVLSILNQNNIMK